MYLVWLMKCSASEPGLSHHGRPSHPHHPSHLSHPSRPSHSSHTSHSSYPSHSGHPFHLSHPSHPISPSHSSHPSHPTCSHPRKKNANFSPVTAYSLMSDQVLAFRILFKLVWQQQEQMRGENKKMSAILKSSSAVSTTSSSSRTSTSTTSTFTGSSTSFTPGTARTSSRQADPLHRSSSDSSLSRLAVSGGGSRSSDGLRSGTASGTQPSGN